MADARVMCVNKHPRQDAHEGITHLGGTTWRWTCQRVIDSINAHTNTFFLSVGGRRAGIARPRRHHRPIRADARRRAVEQ